MIYCTRCGKRSMTACCAECASQSTQQDELERLQTIINERSSAWAEATAEAERLRAALKRCNEIANTFADRDDAELIYAVTCEALNQSPPKQESETERLRAILRNVALAIDWNEQHFSQYYIGEDAAQSVLAELEFDWSLGISNEAVERALIQPAMPESREAVSESAELEVERWCDNCHDHVVRVHPRMNRCPRCMTRLKSIQSPPNAATMPEALVVCDACKTKSLTQHGTCLKCDVPQSPKVVTSGPKGGNLEAGCEQTSVEKFFGRRKCACGKLVKVGYDCLNCGARAQSPESGKEGIEG